MRNSNTLTPENASGKATEAIGQATKIFEDTTKEYGQKFKEGYDVAKDKAQQMGTEVNQFVQKRPLVAIGVAMGVGMLLGRALKASTRRS